MKKIERVLCIIICFVLATVNCFASDFDNVSYEPTKRLVSIKGSFQGDENFVVVSICEVTGSGSSVKLVRTYQLDENGSFDKKIVFPENMAGGNYAVNASNGIVQYTYNFVYVNAAEAQTILNQMKDMEYSDFCDTVIAKGVKLGLKMDEYVSGEILTEAGSKKLTYLYKQMPDTGYTPDEFLKADARISALLEINAGGDVADILDKNVLNFNLADTFTNITKNMETDEKEIVINQIINGSFDEVVFSEELDRIIAYAEVKCAETYSLLEEVFWANEATLIPDMTDYNKIGNDYYKTQVFQLMFKESISAYAAINSAFEKSAKTALANYNASLEEDEYNGGGGGGGGFSSPAVVEKPMPDEQPEENKSDEQQPDTNDGNYIPKDIAGHWAEEMMLSLMERNIMNGYDDSTVRPDIDVTRAEFIKLIVCAFDLENDGSAEFDDVNQNDWYYKYVGSAYKVGIVNGDGNSFYPESNISRQDAATILYRVIGGEKSEAATEINDLNQADSYAIDAIKILNAKGIITGYEGNFMPLKTTTRAECAALIYRILEGK